MGNIIVSEFITIDGIIEDPGGAEKTKKGGWTWPYHSEEIGKFKFEELFGADALLLGRITYDGFAAAWPTMKDEQGFADKMNSMPKHVVSKTLKKTQWNNSHIINENLAEEVNSLKGQYDRNILIFGSAKLASELMSHNLVDEYTLLIYPVVLGEGKRLFAKENDAKLKTAKTMQFESGVVLVKYKLK